MENTFEKLIAFLDCPCTSFPSMRDDDPIMEAYRKAREQGAKEGFVPVLIPQDEELLGTLLSNSDPDSKGDFDRMSSEKIKAYREKMLSAPLMDGKKLLADRLEQCRKEMEEDGYPMEDIMGEMEGGEEGDDRFVSYWDYETEKTVPVLLALIPVRYPWQVFAWLPFGGWNDCPETMELMAISKYWFEQYGAVPAVLNHDTLEMETPSAVRESAAMDLAQEQHGFCPDLVWQCMGEDGTIGLLADTLTQSTVWYFWWQM